MNMLPLVLEVILPIKDWFAVLQVLRIVILKLVLAGFSGTGAIEAPIPDSEFAFGLGEGPVIGWPFLN